MTQRDLVLPLEEIPVILEELHGDGEDEDDRADRRGEAVNFWARPAGHDVQLGACIHEIQSETMIYSQFAKVTVIHKRPTYRRHFSDSCRNS